MKKNTNEKRNVLTVLNLIAFFLSLLLTIGVKTFFSACDAKEDGSFMTCHWAENTVFLMGIILIIFTALSLFLPERLNFKKGLILGSAVLSIFICFVPNILIPLCMMETMQCHAVMRPAVIIFSICIFLLSLVGVAISFRKN